MEDPIMTINLTVNWYDDGCVWARAHGWDAFGVWPYEWKLGRPSNVYEALVKATQEWQEYNGECWQQELSE
jgi:hypothetical protein